MNKVGVFVSLIVLLLALPVSGVAFPGCEESAVDAECTVSDEFVGIPSTMNNAVFQYEEFTIEPDSTVAVTPVMPSFTHNGGNITIIAKRISIGGNIWINGYPGEESWTLNGGNGGTLTLIAKEEFILGVNSQILASGASGELDGCAAGNGGNGGTINIYTVSGAAVSTLGDLIVSGGRGAIISDSCTSGTNGTNGVNGTVTFSTYVPRVVDFSLSGEEDELISGTNVTVVVNAVDEFGDPITPTSVSWSTTNSSIVSITQLNSTHVQVRGILTGEATVTATIDSLSESFDVEVEPGPFDHIAVTQPNETSVYYGELTTFEVRTLDAAGNYVRIPTALYSSISFDIVENQSTGNGGVWSCLMDSTCVAGRYVVNFEGGDDPGTVLLRISHGNQTIDMTFIVVMQESAVEDIRIVPENPTVISGGSNTTFSVIGIDSDGDEAVFQADSWSVTPITGTGTINSNGSLLAGLPGVVRVSATFNEMRAYMNVTIIVGSANRINVSGPSTVVAGNAVVFNATLLDSNSNILSTYNSQAPAFSWSSSSGTIFANGTFVGTTAGNVTITATLVQNPAVTGSATISVTPGQVYSMVVGESGSSITAGGTYVLTAVLVDRFGNGISETDASWTILNATGQATLNGRLITATKIGYVNVYAVSLLNSSLTATGVLSIVPGAPAVLEITPVAPFVRPGSPVSFTSTAFDAYGNRFTPTNVVWSVSNSTVGSISQGGLFTPYAAGSTSVIATISGTGISDSVIVNVLEPLGSQAQVAAQFSTGLPSITIPGSIPRVSVNTAGLTNGLTGLFTAGASSELLLVAALALLLVGLVAYYVSRRNY